MNPEILISLKPQFAAAILECTKRVEYRRRLSIDPSWIWIYVTSPACKLVARVRVVNVLRGTPQEVWKSTGNLSGFPKASFDAYSAGAEEITALILGVVEVFEKSIPLSELRTLDILPPQSFCYLPEVLRNVCVCA